MKKKVVSIMLAIVCTCAMAAGCGKEPEKSESRIHSVSKHDSKEDTKEKDEDEEEEVEEEADEDEEEAVEEEADEDEEEAEESAEEAVEEEADAEETEAVEEEPAEEEPAEEAVEEQPAAQPAEGINLDLDNIQFFVNGKAYTLGQTTLQELIDDGVPFEEGEVDLAGNVIQPNHQSQGFKIELGEYWSAQVYAFNETEENKTISECYINEIYLPVKTDAVQDILSFTFPIDMTKEDLLAAAGEPTKTDHYEDEENPDYWSDTYEYTRDSSKYIGSYGYDLQFINDELRYIYIDYMP